MAHLARPTTRTRAAVARRLVAALAAVALLAALVAGPVSAAPSATLRLSDADFWPGSATTSTVVTFKVTYSHSGGLAPVFVRVHAGGVTKEMQVAAGSNWKQGVVFEITARLPAGTHTPWFEAERGDLYDKLVMSRSITVQGPAPTPEPTPKPTPEPTPKPTPEPTPKPTPKPTAEPTPRPTAQPTPRPTAQPTPKPTPKPTAKPTAEPTPGATGRPSSTSKPDPRPAATQKPSGGKGGGKAGPSPSASPDATPEPTPTPDPGVAVVVPGAGEGGPGTGATDPGDGVGGGPVNDGNPALAGSLGGPSPVESLLPVLAAVLVSAGAVAMLMALVVFGKRRRQPAEGGDEALAAGAATGYASVPMPRPAVQPAPVAVAVDPAAAAAAVTAVQASADIGPAPDLDAHLPRWRRPSLMEARKADPLRGGMPASASLRFDRRAGDAISGLERRKIRYRLVSLLDLPDEVRGVQISTLDEGDEVVLIEKRGTYWRVLCPDGREGWLHKMTLGDVVIDTAGEAESWTSADDGPAPGSFEDVLRAYAESRRQFGDVSGR